MDASQFDIIKGQLENLTQKVEMMERAVVGEERAGHRGLVNRVDMLESWRVNIDLRIATYCGFAIGISFLIRYLVKGSI